MNIIQEKEHYIGKHASGNKVLGLRAFEELNEKEKCRKRKNLWYQRWHLLARELKKHRNNPKRIMEQVYEFMEEVGGHSRMWIAYTSQQDMKLAIDDCLDVDCNECKNRFRCFTE